MPSADTVDRVLWMPKRRRLSGILSEDGYLLANERFKKMENRCLLTIRRLENAGTIESLIREKW